MRLLLQIIIFCILHQSYLQLGFQKLLKPELEGCMRCVCEAATSCDDLYLCAVKSISEDYWSLGGNLTTKPEDSPEALEIKYESCIRNEICVLNTMTNYIDGILNILNDINCDGVIDCRDRLAVHKYGMAAKEPTSTFGTGHYKRFDRCDGHGDANFTDSGWEPKICIDLRSF